MNLNFFFFFLPSSSSSTSFSSWSFSLFHMISSVFILRIHWTAWCMFPTVPGMMYKLNKHIPLLNSSSSLPLWFFCPTKLFNDFYYSLRLLYFKAFSNLLYQSSMAPSPPTKQFNWCIFKFFLYIVSHWIF